MNRWIRSLVLICLTGMVSCLLFANFFLFNHHTDWKTTREQPWFVAYLAFNGLAAMFSGCALIAALITLCTDKFTIKDVAIILLISALFSIIASGISSFKYDHLIVLTWIASIVVIVEAVTLFYLGTKQTSQQRESLELNDRANFAYDQESTEGAMYAE